MTPPDQLQASAPGLLYPLSPRRPPAEQPLQSRRVPLAAALFFPDSAAPAYNATYMRPLDALTRHASSWGRLVTISVFAVLTAGLVMAVWWAATIEERTGTYVVRGTVNGITLDIGDANIDIVGGGNEDACRSRAPTASPSATPPRPSARYAAGRCACARAARPR